MASICFVSDYFLKDNNAVTTGPMVQFYLIGKELASRGWKISHVVSSRNYKAGMIEEHEGMSIHYLLHYRYGELIGFRSFLKKLKEVNADIYYQRGRASMTGMTAYFARRNGKKFIWSSAGEGGIARAKYMREQLKKKSGIRKVVLFPYFWLQDRVYEYGIRKADIIFAQTKYQLTKLKKEFGRDGIVFRSGHPIPDINVIEKPVPPVILWIGSIKKVKQPELFLELAKRLSAENVLFVMVGRLLDDNYRESIMLQNKEQNNFHYIGEIPFDKTSEYFFKASLLVNTTADGYEGLPNAFIQAWLHCTPVVSLYADPDDIIKKHKIGYQTGDFEIMVEKVRQLIGDTTLIQEMGKRARRLAIREFGIQNLVDHFIEVINSDKTN